MVLTKWINTNKKSVRIHNNVEIAVTTTTTRRRRTTTQRRRDFMTYTIINTIMGEKTYKDYPCPRHKRLDVDRTERPCIHQDFQLVRDQWEGHSKLLLPRPRHRTDPVLRTNWNRPLRGSRTVQHGHILPHKRLFHRLRDGKSRRNEVCYLTL
jgi:hypothetical protein